jgi:hypothetical protein
MQLDIAPTGDADTYFNHYMHQGAIFSYSPDGNLRTDTSIRIIEQPKHGKLMQQFPDATDYTKYWYKYIPDADYGEFDHFVMEAKADGITVQIYYTMSVGLPGEPTYTFDDNGNRIDDLSRCPKPYWKISQDTNGNHILTVIGNQSPIVASTTDATALASTLESSILKSLSVDPSSVTFNLANLAGGAVGQDNDNAITLDTTGGTTSQSTRP